jgi:hypothetical protein
MPTAGTYQREEVRTKHRSKERNTANPTGLPCFGYVDVSGYVPLQRVAAGLSTHVFLFYLLQWLSRLNARSLLAPSFLFSPLLSNSSMFLAALTSWFQKFALHRLLVQRKTFRVHLSAIFLLASFGLRNFRISSISLTSFLDGCSFVLVHLVLLPLHLRPNHTMLVHSDAIPRCGRTNATARPSSCSHAAKSPMSTRSDAWWLKPRLWPDPIGRAPAGCAANFPRSFRRRPHVGPPTAVLSTCSSRR